MEKPRCAVCGRSFYSITASHLKKHGLTRADYSRLYPNEMNNIANTDYYGRCNPSEIDVYERKQHWLRMWQSA